jgi:tetratricopeptide (TPR) repeat protein
MKYHQGEEQSKLGQKLSEEAVELAMRGRWEEAVVVNKDIIERFPGDVSAYNRLGKAELELGEIPKAEEAYSKALQIEPTNRIAKRNIARLSQKAEAEAKASMKGTGREFSPGSEGVVEMQLDEEELATEENREEEEEAFFDGGEDTIPEGFSLLD